ncbi:MAG: CbtA family protein [Rhodospirillales bacterium]|nr:CbtA family protein [Rhodospirillales bacterium]
MFGRIILTAFAAGVIAGVFLWAAHMVKTTPLILAAEVYETQDHHHGQAAAPHDHPTTEKAGGEKAGAEKAEWAPGEGFERAAYTLLADIVTAVGFAFLLTGALHLRGHPIDWRQGVLWGLAGFAAFFAAPSLGLPPELPGMQAADLSARQAWWLLTAVATAAGLWCLAFSANNVVKALGLGLIVLPHLIGSPHVAGGQSNVPAELASEFAVTAMVVNGLFWMALGGLTGYFYNRFDQLE